MEVASIVADLWRERIAGDGKQGIFLVLAGFVLSFAFIRMSTRLMRSPRVPWWPGSVVSDGGVHLHHLVFGIATMMAAGTMGFLVLGESPWAEVFAFLFGVGAGLTIDEFALWVYLEDVYWTEQGRVSVDATAIAAAVMGLILLGVSPFSFETGSVGETLASVAVAALAFFLVAIAFGKQRIMHGTVGFFVFPVALYAALRLGKPGSPWARRLYGERRPAKQAAAEARFRPDRRTERVKEAFRDVVGGKPSEGVAVAREEAAAATREAAAQVRERAERLARPGEGPNGD